MGTLLREVREGPDDGINHDERPLNPENAHPEGVAMLCAGILCDDACDMIAREARCMHEAWGMAVSLAAEHGVDSLWMSNYVRGKIQLAMA